MSDFLSYTARGLITDCEALQVFKTDSSYTYSLQTVWKMNSGRLNEDQQGLLKLTRVLDPEPAQVQLPRHGPKGAQDLTASSSS